MSQSADSDLLVRFAREDDEPAILDLINLVQPHAPWTREHFDWQFHKGPFGKPVLRVVEIDGRVAAFVAASMRKVAVGGAILDGFVLQDGMTHPNFRGRRCFHHLAASLKESQRTDQFVGLLFPNKTSENTFRRNGYTPVMNCPLCVANTRSRPSAKFTALRPVSEFGPEVLDVWNDAGMSVGVVRNAALLNWRYGVPSVPYHRFVIDDGAGFAVLKLYNRNGTHVVNVCELVVRQRETASLKRALDDIHVFAQAHSAAEIQAFSPRGHAYWAALSDAGFARDATMDRVFITDGPPDLLPLLATESAWHLTQGDNDVY